MAQSPQEPKLSDINALLKTLKSFNNLLPKDPPGVRTNIYIDVMLFVFYIGFVVTVKFLLWGEELAHKGLITLCIAIIAAIVFFWFGRNCYEYHIKGAHLNRTRG